MLSLFSTRKKRVFFDHASTTPINQKVVTAMKPYFSSYFHNPSALYKEAVDVKKDIEHARTTFAHLIDARPHTIVFYDGATEANNLIILGIIDRYISENPNTKPHIVIGAGDHSSTIESVKMLGERGEIEYDLLPLTVSADYNYQELKKLIKENTVLVSIGYANGEIGTVHDVRQVAKLIRKKRKEFNSQYPLLHVDAVQAFQYVADVRMPSLGCDVCIVSGSKMYGPKKTAAAFIKDTDMINPVIVGGGQESGLRPGTENIPGIIGLVTAAEIARESREVFSKKLAPLVQYIEEELKKAIPNMVVNSSAASKLPNILNITVPNISHEEMVIRMDARGFMISAKSACKSDTEGDSHVIKAIRENNTESLRISLGRESTKKQCTEFIKIFVDEYSKLKNTHEKYK